MAFVPFATAVAVALLLAVAVGGWIKELTRDGGAVSARESRAATDAGRSFYGSREARAEAMRERIRRERTRREKARARAPRPAATAGPDAGADRAPARPPTPEAVHRATLELPAGPVDADTLRVHYRRLVVAYHPDRVVGLGAKLQRLAEEETKAINEAYAFFKRSL